MENMLETLRAILLQKGYMENLEGQFQKVSLTNLEK